MARDPEGSSSELDAILADARRMRRRASRATWMVALLVGGLGVAGFIAALVVDGSPVAAAPATRSARSLGFASGLAIGLLVGVALGFAIARRRDGQRSGSPGHSSRKIP